MTKNIAFVLTKKEKCGKILPLVYNTYANGNFILKRGEI